MCVTTRKKSKASKATKTKTTRNTVATDSKNLGAVIVKGNGNGIERQKFGPENRRALKNVNMQENEDNAKNTKNEKPATMMSKMIAAAERKRRSQVEVENERSLNAIGTRADINERSEEGEKENSPLPTVILKRKQRKMPLFEEEYDYGYEEDEKKKKNNKKVARKNEMNKERSTRSKSIIVDKTQSSELVEQGTSSLQSTAHTVEKAESRSKKTQTRKRRHQKSAKTTAATWALEQETQDEKDKQARELANQNRNARHIARANKTREQEAREAEMRRQAGSESDDEPRARRIRWREVQDLEKPLNWRPYERRSKEYFDVYHY